MARWFGLALLLAPGLALAQDVGDVTVASGLTDAIASSDPEEISSALKIVVVLTALTFLPALLLVMTPFTRFIIVFSLVRQALGLQQSPPNQVLVGLSLALTLLVMQPTLDASYRDGVEPYLAGEITSIEAYDASVAPFRTFMLRNVEREDLATALRLARVTRPASLDEVPTSAVVTAFLLAELRKAFIIGVKVYVPFLVVDVVVASVLLGMGMMMLPPVVISLPFKLLLFVLIDGWGLLVQGLVAGFD